MKKTFLFPIFYLFCLLDLTDAYGQENLINHIETNILCDQERIIRLNDGSYWMVKLTQGFFTEDITTGAYWWRFDRIIMGRNNDQKFPYLMQNLESGEIVACKPYDPALCHPNVIIFHPTTPLPTQLNENLAVFAIVRTASSLFIKLTDSSYWEVMAEKCGWFSTCLPQTFDWQRFDPIIFQKSGYIEYPDTLRNLANNQELICRQIDPAIPSSLFHLSNSFTKTQGKN